MIFLSKLTSIICTKKLMTPCEKFFGMILKIIIKSLGE